MTVQLVFDVMVNVMVPPSDKKVRDSGSLTFIVAAAPACATVTVCVTLPAVNVTVAVRDAVEVLASVEMLRVLLPVPEVELTVHHDSLDDAIQLVLEVTVIDWLLPSASNERDD